MWKRASSLIWFIFVQTHDVYLKQPDSLINSRPCGPEYIKQKIVWSQPPARPHARTPAPPCQHPGNGLHILYTTTHSYWLWRRHELNCSGYIPVTSHPTTSKYKVYSSLQVRTVRVPVDISIKRHCSYIMQLVCIMYCFTSLHFTVATRYSLLTTFGRLAFIHLVYLLYIYR